MTNISLMDILEQELLSAQHILKELYIRGTVEVHTEDLVDVVTHYNNPDTPLKVSSLGNCFVSVSI